MIACITIGTTTLQGELIAKERRPIRRRPHWEYELETFGTIEHRGIKYSGPLVRSVRRCCDECRQPYGAHLDWCPWRD